MKANVMANLVMRIVVEVKKRVPLFTREVERRNKIDEYTFFCYTELMSFPYSQIDADVLAKNSPFKILQGKEYGANTIDSTPELLNFQLQNQHNNKMQELNEKERTAGTDLLYSLELQGSFNERLQMLLDQKQVKIEEEVPGLDSSPSLKDEESDTNSERLDSETEGTGKMKPNYLNLRVLIENSVFDVSMIKKEAILTLSHLKHLKKTLQYKLETRDYLLSKFQISHEFLLSLITNPKWEEQLDVPFLLKSLKLNVKLQDVLFSINNDIESLTRKLNNHNHACLVLGYVEDIRLAALSSGSMNAEANCSQFSMNEKQDHSLSTSESVQKSFDSLFSLIASTAAQRNIQLPSPTFKEDEQSSFASRLDWTQKCIATIVLDQKQGSRPHSNDEAITEEIAGGLHDSAQASQSKLAPFGATSDISLGGENEKSVSELKTALNDLRFSHQYLTREFEHSRASSMKTIQEYRKRMNFLEKEINKVKDAEEGQREISCDDIEAKDREISKLRKDLNLLRIETLGYRTSKSPSSSCSANISCLSPVAANLEYLEEKGYPGEQSSPYEIRPNSSGSSMSTGILRDEFKKIVEELHDQYELELCEERMRRRKLEEELKNLTKDKN